MTPFIYILGFALLLATLAAANSGEENPHSCAELCCKGVAYERNRTTRCCGKEVYDFTVFGCCENQIVDLPNQYDLGFGCCKSENGIINSYNPNKHVCCEGQLIEKPECGKYYECCGGKLLDYYEEICCNNEIVPKDKEQVTVCIGNEVKILDAGTEVCGEEIIVSEEKTCCQTWSYDEESQQSKSVGKSHDKTEDVNRMCCGLESYDYNTEICCYHPDGAEHSYVLEKPEGALSNTYQECCGETIITNYTIEGCCYDTVYNKEESQCCGKILYDLSEVDDEKFCCWNSGEFYDYKTQRCTKKGVSDIKSASSEEEGSDEATEQEDGETEEGGEEKGRCVSSSPYEQYNCDDQCPTMYSGFK